LNDRASIRDTSPRRQQGSMLAPRAGASQNRPNKDFRSLGDSGSLSCFFISLVARERNWLYSGSIAFPETHQGPPRMNLPLPAIEKPTRVRFGVLGFACALSMITYLD